MSRGECGVCRWVEVSVVSMCRWAEVSVVCVGGQR